MILEKKELINNLTQDIIKEYNIKIPITNIEEVVQSLGGEIETDYNLEYVVSGSIRKQNDSFVISISPYQTEERKRFTVAHELGHLFLHMGYKINDDLWKKQDNEEYYRVGNSMLEYQANEFAAALLMPKEIYKEKMDKYTKGNMVDTAQVAMEFGVSVSAASNRGKFLGYLAW